MKKQLIITGASKGIGKAAAQLFVTHGWDVINISRSACEVSGVRNLALDLGDPSAIKHHEADLLELLNGEALCLVHNAAFYQSGSIQTMDNDLFRQSLEVNLIAPIALNQLYIPQMKPGSSIIYIGSTLSCKAVKNAAPYVMSKHASIGMMRATCQDLDDSGIHTCCICPGFTDTEMLRSHLADPAILKSITDTVTARRLVEPREIASLIHYCAENPVINGSVLHANLGQVER